MKEHMQKQADYNETMNKINMMMNPQAVQNTVNQQSVIIQQLSIENGQLKDQVQYLENKIKQLINDRIQEKMKEKNLQVSQQIPSIKHIQLSQSPPNIV